MPYIICEKRRGHPKVNVEVCRRKCKFMEECKSYERYVGASTLEDSPPDGETHATAVSSKEVGGKEVQAA